ncbi:hypothetical protein D5086_018635 [Populus alba]|uniref:Uncharacterized protein n=2 Tax=Populus alba TaxID=43335 RepID=A0ACC4BQY9_POPAL|nr:uncharacterized protein LOC118058820 [Populus alba]TKS05506.1 uncharacterized protein D5086_0000136030 [Populus alba]
MSRCIRFPPPGYVWNGVKGEALIELIKVRREKAEVEKRRKKEEKKKEKRRQKMEEGLEGGQIKKKRYNPHRRQVQHRSEDGDVSSYYQAKNEHGFRRTERTSLAGELKQPSIPDSLYDSFDTFNHGSVFWIDIQLQGHEDQDLVFGKPVRSITAMDYLVQEKSELPKSCTKEEFFSTCSESTTTAFESDRPGVELYHSCSQTELVRDRKAAPALISHYSGSGLQHTELNFWELDVNWIPLPTKNGNPEFDNPGWLYERKPERLPRSDYTKIYRASNDRFSRPISSLYPTAQYLAQAEIHALPFTIPF